MDFPPGLFGDSIEEKKVYRFTSTLISSDEPHYFICIKKTDGGLLLLTCCTSQRGTIDGLVKTRKLPLETIVYINHLEDNPFTKATYVNCNDVFPYTVAEFESKYLAGGLKFKGEISDHHYEQILNGIHASKLVNRETKDMIPTSIIDSAKDSAF